MISTIKVNVTAKAILLLYKDELKEPHGKLIIATDGLTAW